MKNIVLSIILLATLSLPLQAKKRDNNAEILAAAIPIETINHETYPDKDIWILSGVVSKLDDVREALISAASENRSIELTLLNMTEIHDKAFLECTSLALINAPEVTTLGQDAFANCASLAAVTLPMLSTVGESAFNSCSALTDLSIPNASSIKGNAFLQCDTLTSLTLGTDGAGIGDLSSDAFDGFNTESCSLTIKSGVVTIEDNILTIQSTINITFLSIVDAN